MTQILLNNAQQGHAALVGRAWPYAKALLTAGKKVLLTVAEYEEDRTVQQNKFYWGPCLREIADQAVVGGVKYTPEAWHEYYKRQILGYEIKKVKVAGSQRTRVIRRLRSTTGLKVKPMGVYLDKVQAHAAGDMGVVFSCPKWADFKPDGWIDPETGEINNA